MKGTDEHSLTQTLDVSLKVLVAGAFRTGLLYILRIL
jgi:hypothetical protein